MKASICCVSGQDGSYLAQFLLATGYEVIGTSRDAHTAFFQNHERLGIVSRVPVETMAMHDFRSVPQVLSKRRSHEIYNLSGHSSGGRSFDQPVETLEA